MCGFRVGATARVAGMRADRGLPAGERRNLLCLLGDVGSDTPKTAPVATVRNILAGSEE